MAVIVPGPIVADIRGKCGGVTYSRNQGGLYVKANPVWEQPESEHRDATQAVIRDLPSAWSGELTEEQRQGWRNYAVANPRPNRWGHQNLHNGYAFWLRTNAYLKRIGQTPLYYDPPTIPPTGPVSWTLTPDIDGNEYDIVFPVQQFPITQTNIYCYAFDQLPTATGRTGARGPWRYMTMIGVPTDGFPFSSSMTPCWPLAVQQHRAVKLITIWHPAGAFAHPFVTNFNT
jgi:hypothetical protein